MNIVNLKDIKLIYRNPLNSYTLTMRKQKEKLRKQFHSALWKKKKEQNTYQYIYLKKQKIYKKKIIKPSWKKAKMTQTDGEVYHVHGLEESIQWKQLYYPK